MKVSKKSEYAVRALIKMAQSTRAGVQWLQIAQIAQVTQIPEKFLEQILLQLKNEGFLKSRRGIGGGYSLKLSERVITLDKVLTALEGASGPAPDDTTESNEVAVVLALALWKAEEAARVQLRSKSLTVLVDEAQAKAAARNYISHYEI